MRVADEALAVEVVAVLERDGRWLRASTLMHRMMKRRPPPLEPLLSGQRPLQEASPEEREAWRLFVETIVPLVRLGRVDGMGNFGTDESDEPPVDHPFCRVRALTPGK